jgi:hypothetical protein
MTAQDKDRLRPRPAGAAVERRGTRLNTLLLLGFAFALATASLGCSSSRNSSSQYPITQPLDPVTNQEIQYVR